MQISALCPLCVGAPSIISVRIHIDEKECVVIEHTVHHLYYGCVALPRLGNFFFCFYYFSFYFAIYIQTFLETYPRFLLLFPSFHLLAANFNLHFVSLHGIRTRVIKTRVLNDTSPKSTILNEHSSKVYKP